MGWQSGAGQHARASCRLLREQSFAMVSYPSPQEVAEGDAFYQVVGEEWSLPIQFDEDGQWLD